MKVSLLVPSFHGASMSLLKSMNIKKSLYLCIFFLAINMPLIAHAQDITPIGINVDILPAKTFSSDSSYANIDTSTHPPVRLTPDKSELIRLEREAKTIIIGNPAHLNILADSAKTLVLVPKSPGATHFTVLDHESNILMQRHVIVASPKKKYIRIRQSCATSDDENCQPIKVYYCPDMCHEISIASSESDANSNDGAMSETAENASYESSGDKEINDE